VFSLVLGGGSFSLHVRRQLGGFSRSGISVWIALWKEHTKGKWVYPGVPAFILLKRNLSLIAPAAQSVCFFDSVFNREFFSRFGPADFMGIQLAGAWWVVLYYIVWLVVLNIFGEELWWRGYVLPRQELFFGRATWIVHGIFWSAFHFFIQPTLFDTLRMAVTGCRSLSSHGERRILGPESSAIALPTCRCY
jgi:hypothetical protein